MIGGRFPVRPGKARFGPGPHDTVKRRVFNCGIVLATGFLVSACALNKPMSAIDKDPSIITASVSETVEAGGIAPSDTDAIRTAVAGAMAAEGDAGYLLSWDNPETGNSGTISAINEFAGSQGLACREFSTTLDNYAGVTLYRGEACESRKGSWILSWLRRGDK
ncbi:MAG: hypothetical protein KDJ80_08185 [Nitratireductor sp.]|nr:hypothetical protein [Nitratireductor sp.]